MVGTILYVVNVDRQNQRGTTVFWIHLLSYLCGAAFIGGLLGAFGGILRSEMSLHIQDFMVLAITGLVGMLYSFREFGLINVPALKVSRQVFSKWRLTVPAKKLALLYGFELGAGLTTYITATTFYVVAVWVILVGDPLLGACGMSAFGLGRAIPIFWLGRHPGNAEERIQLSDALQRWEPMVHLLNGIALGFTGACFLVAGLIIR